MNVGSTKNQLSEQGWITAAIVDWENGSQKKDIKYVGQVIAFQILHQSITCQLFLLSPMDSRSSQQTTGCWLVR